MRLLAFLSVLLAAFSAYGQSYPSKPIRIIVPFGPGGSGDITARTFAQYLEAHAKQPVVIENKPGANGILGTEAVKTAAPDGYTLLLTTNTTHAANVSLYKTLPYDPLKDFEHVGLFGTFASVAVVRPESGIRSIRELVAFAKENPGKVFFGHYNSASQMSAELFRQRAGIEMSPVPYKTIGNAVTDLLGGQIQVLFMEYVSGSSHIEAGRVVPLGVTARERHRAWPQVPAIAEFYPGYEITAFLGLAAPAHTPREVVDTLHTFLERSLADPKVSEGLDKLGMTTRPLSRGEYRRYVEGEIARWRGYVKAAGIQPE